MGRLVKTHSTYLEGLIKILKSLATEEKVKTVTPGEIKRVKGKSHTPGVQFRITLSVSGGYKLIARRGYMMQEVFVICDLEQKELEAILRELSH